MVTITQLPYIEHVPSVTGCAVRLLPYLALLADLGWPGLSERDRDDVTNIRADLEAAITRRLRVVVDPDMKDRDV